MNKICTSKEQSQKLIDLGIDVITADMDYVPFANDHQNYDCVVNVWNNEHEFDWIPAWSLTALLNILESEIDDEEGNIYQLNIEKEDTLWNVWYRELYEQADPIEIESTEELVDTCVEMILKLHELKLI